MDTKDKHTEGPWSFAETWRPPIGIGPHKLNSEGNVFWGYHITGRGETGGTVLPTLASVHNFPDNMEANARLIASAPTLKAEVENQIETLRGISAMSDTDGKRMKLWARDSLSGHAEPLDSTLLKISDERNALEAEVERLREALKDATQYLNDLVADGKSSGREINAIINQGWSALSGTESDT